MEYTIRLIKAKDGSIVGAELEFRNVSEAAITIRGYTPPMSAIVYHDKVELGPKVTNIGDSGERRIPKKSGDYVLEPGKAEKHFLPMSEVIDLRMVPNHIDGCSIAIHPRSYPLGGRWTRFDSPMRIERFNGCALDAQSLKLDARHAYEALKTR